MEVLDTVGSCLQHCSFIVFIVILFLLLVLSIPAIRSLVCDEEQEEHFDTFIGQQIPFLDEKEFLRVTIDEN